MRVRLSNRSLRVVYEGIITTNVGNMIDAISYKNVLYVRIGKQNSTVCYVEAVVLILPDEVELKATV